jgi:hypothetical protein
VNAAGTPLDAAHAALAAAPDDEAARLRFHERVLDAELVVPLRAEAGEGSVDLAVFDLSDGSFVLAFDREDRMADFLEAPARFAALSGRRLAALLDGRGIGLALNLGVASATLLPPASVDWLARMAGAAPQPMSARIRALSPPGEVPAALLAGLATKLAAMAGAVEAAFLAKATHEGGEARLLVALAGVPEAARDGVAAAVAEAVRFAEGAPPLDVLFLDAGAPLLAAAARNGARLAIPRPASPPAPGTDPDRPPRLRHTASG